MQSIDIRTTQNVTIEYELASLRDRVLAFFIDLVIVGAFYILFFIMVISALRDSYLGSGLLLRALGFLLPIAALLFYHFLSEALANGQSWGKKAMGIKVVRLDGREPGLSDYLLRAIFHIIDSLLSLGILAALLISSSAKNQRLGDMTANTTIIKVKQSSHFRLDDILKINSLEDYEPQYPEVRQLNEEDLLLIKNVISRYRKHRNKAHDEVVNEVIKRVCSQLDIREVPANKIEFLKVLIRDYIVLTR